jgi:hypothetical protein
MMVLLYFSRKGSFAREAVGEGGFLLSMLTVIIFPLEAGRLTTRTMGRRSSGQKEEEEE